MNKIIELYAYTLLDIEKEYGSISTYKMLLDACAITSSYYDLIDTALTQELYKKYIYPKYRKYFWILSNEELSFEKVNDAFKDKDKESIKNLGYKLCEFINTTADKYIKLHNAYNKELSDLIAGASNVISTDEKGINNDTPQTDEAEGLFADKYASFITHNINSQTSTTNNTYLEKIASLYAVYDSMMTKWADLFIDYLEGLEI